MYCDYIVLQNLPQRVMLSVTGLSVLYLVLLPCLSICLDISHDSNILVDNEQGNGIKESTIW